MEEKCPQLYVIERYMILFLYPVASQIFNYNKKDSFWLVSSHCMYHIHVCACTWTCTCQILGAPACYQPKQMHWSTDQTFRQSDTAWNGPLILAVAGLPLNNEDICGGGGLAHPTLNNAGKNRWQRGGRRERVSTSTQAPRENHAHKQQSGLNFKVKGFQLNQNKK